MTDSTNPDLLVVPSMGNNTLTVIDLDAHEVVRHVGLPKRGPSTVFASPDRTKLHVVLSARCNLATVDVATWQTDYVTALDGTFLDRARVPSQSSEVWGSVILQGHVHALDAASGKVLRSFPKIGPNFTVSEDAKTLYTIDQAKRGQPSTFHTRDALTGETIGQTEVPAFEGIALGMELHGDLLYAVDMGKSGGIHAIDPRDPAAPAYLGRLAVGCMPLGGTYMPDGTLWLPNGGDGTISIIDTTTFTVRHTLDIGRFVGGITSYNGRAYVNQSLSTRLGHLRTWWRIVPGMYLGVYVTPPSGVARTRRILDLGAEVVAYDAATYERLPLEPLPLPSTGYTSAIVRAATT